MDNPGDPGSKSGSAALFDRALLRARARRLLRSRASRILPGDDFLTPAAVEDLDWRLSTVARQFDLCAVTGAATAMATALARSGKARTVITLEPALGGTGDLQVVGDDEFLPFRAGSLDLAVSVLSLHWANDLPGALIQMRRTLRPDGLFLACLLGGQTLSELRVSLLEAESEITGGAAPRVSPFADLRDLGGLLQRAGFALPVADADRLTARYDDIVALMRDLRAMGWTNALNERSRKALRRDVLMRAGEIYRERFSDPDGRIRATFEMVTLTAWAPHPDQQKPLKPGSAKIRLADALGTREEAAGEKTPGHTRDKERDQE